MKSMIGARGASAHTYLLAGVAAVGLLMPAMAHAQTAEPDADEALMEDEDSQFDDAGLDNVIIVTATKREQTLQETPVSVSVTSGETLEQAQIRDIIDLQTVAPSLRVSQLQSSSSTTFIIRGFGNGSNNLGFEPSVGVFIDGVFRSRVAGSLNDLANVQRIEVLRGPQSTLFGKNASAGVISVVTREPQFDFGGSVEVGYGNFNNLTIKGDVTGPISDTIAFSLDGSYNKRDGYGEIVNLNTDISDRNRWTARGQLLFEPTPDLRFRLIGDYSTLDEVCCITGNLAQGPTVPAILGVGGQIDSPDNFFGYETYLNVVPVNEIDNYGVSLQGDWSIGAFSVTSITSYREMENFQDQDIDFTSAALATEFRDQKAETFTQELRIASDFDGPFNFLLGGYYFDESITQNSGLIKGDGFRGYGTIVAQVLSGDPTFSLNPVEFLLGIPQNSIFAAGPWTDENFSMDNTAYSIFGTVDFEVTDRLTLTGGFNYTKDEKDYALSLNQLDPIGNINVADAFLVGALGSLGVDATDPAQLGAFVTNPATAPIFGLLTQVAVGNPAGVDVSALPPAAQVNPLLALAPLQFQRTFLSTPNAVEDGRTRDDDWSYTLRAAYDVTDNINAYVSYATGFKASSVNLSRDSRPFATDFTPATVAAGVPAYVGGSSIILNTLGPASPIVGAGLPVTNLETGSRFAAPEEAKVWEFGVKGQFDRFGFNLALFDQSLEGFQDFLFTGTGFQLSNAGEQSVKGFEFDATVNPVDPLVFNFALTYLDAVYDSFVDSPVGDLSGQRPGSIPEFSINTGVTYTHEFLDSGNQLVARVDYSHESNTQTLNGVPSPASDAFDQAVARQFRREVNLVNGSLTFQMDNGFEFGVWARNLLNDQYILQIFAAPAQDFTVNGYPSVPRTYGAVARFKF